MHTSPGTAGMQRSRSHSGRPSERIDVGAARCSGVSASSAADVDLDQQVTVDELSNAVTRALTGCASQSAAAAHT